jgi:uncharacterized membrane protein YphA (DoxX/SURF4 family)
MKAPFLLGRAILGGFFLYNGILHFTEKDSHVQYAATKKIPAPGLAVHATGAMLAFGGASLILGLKPKWGTMALIGFLGAAATTMHDFWNAEDPQQKQNDTINFAKNIALAGATLALAGVEEPWPASVAKDHRNRFDKLREFGKRQVAA